MRTRTTAGASPVTRRAGASAITRALAVLAVLVPLAASAACGGGNGDPAAPAAPKDGPDVLRVLAGSEIKDLEPLLKRAAGAAGVRVELSYAGTLDGADQVASGGADGRYDATWFSSNRYLSLIDGATARLSTQTKVMVSPVLLGLKSSKAHELGWDSKPVTWNDIAEAARARRFTFGMTSPAASNSGFSALVGVTAALSDAAEAVGKAQIDAATPKLKQFFSAQTLTAGSSGWLADAYVEQASVDGLVNYESVLLGLNASGTLREPLTLIYPTDGVVTADYPLTLLSSAAAGKKDLYGKLATWLRRPEIQREIMTTTYRRPIVPEVRPDQRFGSAPLVELPFPNRRSAADELIGVYLNQVRKPSRTLFVLDTSGSMAGGRIDGLKQALTALAGADTSATGTFSRFRDRETVTMIPFSTAPGMPQTFTLPDREPGPTLQRIRSYGEGPAGERRHRDLRQPAGGLRGGEVLGETGRLHLDRADDRWRQHRRQLVRRLRGLLPVAAGEVPHVRRALRRQRCHGDEADRAAHRRRGLRRPVTVAGRGVQGDPWLPVVRAAGSSPMPGRRRTSPGARWRWRGWCWSSSASRARSGRSWSPDCTASGRCWPRPTG
jgi:Ca-activated chloride channel family protein